MKGPKAPPGLQKDGRWFWHRSMDEREFSECHDIKRLEMGARTLDEIMADQETLGMEGRFTTDRWGRRIPHPALKTLQENRILFLRIVRELGLDLTIPDSRPPRQY
jgi:phage terminase small subunit